MVLDPIDYHSMNMEVNGTRNCFCSKISDLQCFYIVQNLRLKLNSCILRSDLDKLLIYKTHPSFWFLHDTCPSFSVIFLLISGRVTLIQGYFDLHCKAELALYKNDSRDISVKNLTNDAVRLRQWSVRSLSVLLWRGCNLYSDFECSKICSCQDYISCIQNERKISKTCSIFHWTGKSKCMCKIQRFHFNASGDLMKFTLLCQFLLKRIWRCKNSTKCSCSFPGKTHTES